MTNCNDSTNITSSTTIDIVIDDDFVTTRRSLRQPRRDEKTSNNDDDTDDGENAIPIPLATATVMISRDEGRKKKERERNDDKRTRRRTRVRDHDVVQRRRLLLLSSSDERRLQQRESNRTPPRSFDGIKKLCAAANTTIINKNDDDFAAATATAATITASINSSSSSSSISSTHVTTVIARLVKWLYNITMLILVMHEILLLQYYHNNSNTPSSSSSAAAKTIDTTVQLIIDSITMIGWTSRVHHVAFVCVHIVKGIVFAIQYATTKTTTRTKATTKMRRQQQHVITMSTIISFLWFASTFGVVFLCWLAILPLFDSNNTNNDDYSTSDFSPFIKWSSYSTQQQYDWWYSTTTTTSATAIHVITVTHPRYSIVDILTRNAYQQFTTSVKTRITERVIREAYYGLLRPFHFHTKLRKLLRALHYIKFIGPLIGTCNKCRGHILDMIVKRRLYCKSKIAQNYWTSVINNLSHQTKQERVVLLLQRRFRERRKSVTRRRFALLSSSSSSSSQQTSNTATAEDNVIHQHHDRIRSHLADECLKSKTSLRKIELIEEEHKLLRQITMLDGINITQHKHKERTRKKRLLLSPRTNFAVRWKFLTIICAVIEISQFIFAPSLAGELKKMPLEMFLGKVIINGKQREYNSMFYYNDNVIIVLSHIVISTLVAIINTITFLDVFITFFTGEIVRQTSKTTINNNTVTQPSSKVLLVPKSFFTRWIIPGIGLQLIVNPTMSLFNSWVKDLFVHVIGGVGPSLCLHLLLSIMPFVIVMYDRILDVII